MNKEDIKTVLFGYDRKTVNIFLKKLHRMQEEELEELRRKVEKAGEEQGRLAAELVRLAAKKKDAVPVDLRDTVRSRVNETVQHLQQLNESDRADSLGLVSNKAINFYDAAAKRARKLSLLRERTLPAKVTPKDTESVETEPIENFSKEPAHPETNSVILTPMMKSEMETAELPKVSAGASDIVSVPETNQLNAAGYQWVPTSASAAPQAKAAGMGFWGDADTFLDPMGGNLQVPVHEETAAAVAFDLPSFFDAEEPPSITVPQLIPNEAVGTRTPFAAEPAATMHAPIPESAQASTPSNTLASQGERISIPQLDALKRNYIVGKLAGEDLMDRNGRVLITKNTVITEDAMKQAENEGKLAELIVNMIIPGLED